MIEQRVDESKDDNTYEYKEDKEQHNEDKEHNEVNTNIKPVELHEPYLPKEISGNKKYTLVLDLDETLVHYVEVNYIINNLIKN